MLTVIKTQVPCRQAPMATEWTATLFRALDGLAAVETASYFAFSWRLKEHMHGEALGCHVRGWISSSCSCPASPG